MHSGQIPPKTISIRVLPNLQNCMHSGKIPHIFSGGSKNFPWGGGVDLRRGHFSPKMYVKMKKMGPVGGRAPGTPPRSANNIIAKRKWYLVFA